MSEKLGHVRVDALRMFIKKHNNFFNQRRIMTLKKQEAIDIINNGLSKAPESVAKEWNRLKTKKGEKGDKTGPSKARPLPRRRGRAPKTQAKTIDAEIANLMSTPSMQKY